MHDDQVELTTDIVATLIREQFPQTPSAYRSRDWPARTGFLIG
jgi:hypothetical protein